MKNGAKGTVVLEEKRPPLAARVLGIAVVLVMAGVLVVWGVDLGKRIMGASHGSGVPDVQRQLDDAQAEIARLTAERDALQAALKAAGVPAPPSQGVGLTEGAGAAASGFAASAAAAGTAASGKITALPPK
ncbi:hypothetical protein [Pseudoduganella ginsengisoli]|uniref:Uncharacterized protein n=1 Tax=Pseudoduganella ginsengisoli TaxID=1462440 RepID=A0A6L6PXY3_9BURK|nr:hypothetical protein [Pseudoduganella ginsengisoli]MTW02014.1 hypothetical protein [Pseudoduganella ginsengisoli]